jgi:hypothetical protein
MRCYVFYCSELFCLIFIFCKSKGPLNSILIAYEASRSVDSNLAHYADQLTTLIELEEVTLWECDKLMFNFY